MDDANVPNARLPDPCARIGLAADVGLDDRTINTALDARRAQRPPSLVRKTLPLLIARLAAAATTLMALALVARMLGIVQLGAVALGLTVGTLLAGISEAGMTAWMVREVARSPKLAGRYLSVLLAIRAVLLPVTSCLTAIFVIAAFHGLASEIMIVALTIAVQQVADTVRGVFIARGSMVIAGAQGTVENLAWLGAVAVALRAGHGGAVAFGCGLAVVCVSSFLVIGLAWIGGAPLTFFSKGDLRAALRELPVFGGFSIASAASLRMDTILVGLLLPTGAVAAAGAYFGATRLVAAFEYLPQTIGRALLPDVAQMRFADGSSTQPQAMRQAVRMLLALSVPVPFAMVLGGEWILHLVLGPEAASYGWIMAWLALALPFRFVAYLLGTLLTGADAQAVRLRALLVALGVLISIDVLVLPTLGIVGAVAGFVCFSATLFLLYERDARQALGLAGTSRLLLAPLLLSFVAAVPAGLVRTALPSQAAPQGSLAVFGVTYVAVAGAYLLLTKVGDHGSPTAR